PLSRAVAEFRRARPRSELVVQSRFAGAPAILRGGRGAVGPRRAIVLLCDSRDAVLAFCVGVPTGQQLLAMAEDADEILVLQLADTFADQDALDGEAQRDDPLVGALHQ